MKITVIKTGTGADEAQAQAVAAQLQQSYTQSAEVTVVDGTNAADNLATDIIVIAGRDGLEAFKKAKAANPTAFFVWSGEKHFPAINELTEYPNVMAIPAGDESFDAAGLSEKCTLVRPIGVPHSMNDDRVAASVAVKDFNKGLFTEAYQDKTLVGVMLPEDYQCVGEGNWQTFAVEEARKLAKQVASAVIDKGISNPYVLVLNGFNTGLVNPLTGQPLADSDNAHKALDEEGIDEVTLAVSQVFEQQFGCDNVEPWAAVEGGQFDSMAQLFYLLNQKSDGTFFFFPQQSITHLSEAQWLPEGVTTVGYESEHLDKTHQGIFQAGFDQGVMSKLEGEKIAAPALRVASVRAAMTIATQVLSTYQAAQPTPKPSEHKGEAPSPWAQRLEGFRQNLPETPDCVKPYMTEQNYQRAKWVGGGALALGAMGFFLARTGAIERVIESCMPSPGGK